MTETNAERYWLLKCKQFASVDDINKLIEKVNEYKSKLRYMTHHRDEQSERVQELESYCSKSANFINLVELEQETARLQQENAEMRSVMKKVYSNVGAYPKASVKRFLQLEFQKFWDPELVEKIKESEELK